MYKPSHRQVVSQINELLAVAKKQYQIARMAAELYREGKNINREYYLRIADEIRNGLEDVVEEIEWRALDNIARFEAGKLRRAGRVREFERNLNFELPLS